MDELREIIGRKSRRRKRGRGQSAKEDFLMGALTIDMDMVPPAIDDVYSRSAVIRRGHEHNASIGLSFCDEMLVQLKRFDNFE
tara:strand:+ start:629 stop:877 length:249 start_codon:yes stop_codon:yes gene_type:complete